MHEIAKELDRQLDQLDSARAAHVERLVREALALAGKNGKSSGSGGNYGEWPDRYFERTAGALAGEPFERPSQGNAPNREAW
jgi:hypothetical protein